MSLLAALLAVIGFTCIALGMGRHQGELLKHRLSPQEQRRAKVAGWAALGCAYAAATAAWGAAVGTVLWLGLLSLGAMTVLLMMSWRSNRR